MKEPNFPIIDITEDGFLGDDCFPIHSSSKISISIKDFNKHFLNTIHYDSEGKGFRISGYELISSSFFIRTKEIRLNFTAINESIDLNSLKQLGIQKASQIYFLEDAEVEGFKDRINSIENIRELIILLSEHKEEIFK
jgi:hypothetical protein